MREIVIATRNRHKVKEIRRILKDLDTRLLTLDDIDNAPVVDEDGDTFEKNASKKAAEISRVTDKVTLADDSGLMVDALKGKPGVRSSRFAGERADDAKNNSKLLEALEGIPSEKRTARFVCVISIAQNGIILDTVKGACEGRIAFAPRGSSGFGYDPLFISPHHDKTFAELGPAVKDRTSHRYRALRKAKESLERILKDLSEV